MGDNSIKYSSPGNLISFEINKNYSISNFNVDESLLDKNQKELLEEMIVSSMNDAISKVKDLNVSDDNKNDNYKNLFNAFNMKDMDKAFADITKMTTIKYDENGKPIINISLDAINPDIISRVNDMINNNNNNNDDKDKN
ncbi:YbaB/EbfC family nucleoid-associated protein [Brachyspira pilosicoli]|uniref:YbaB/EbfC family nucleoid-associated protein n=1 Tax=Brachyspira pilosicoli TaxID=52584 RepID=UPI001C68069A|nr:YbaB/EbfC family nucleoid-associated protein [Brachyspira pilosicoli]MBW5382820.1 YbaB/EbfC family DNA-binding protein [Brachyspira pilosicoli]